MSDDAPFRPALQRAFAHAAEYLANLDRNPVAATATLAQLRERLVRPLQEEGVAPERVVDDLVRDTAGGIIGSAGGRFFGWVIGGSLPAALAADWLAATWDQNAASYSCGPAEAVIEEACGAWLKDLLGLPAAASFALTSGCQMAHFTALAAARLALLAARDWDVERDGLFGAPRIRILTSDQYHGSVERAARLLGFGATALRVLRSDDAGRLEAETLEQALRTEAQTPAIVLLQAGDLNIGAYDPFVELIPIAHRFGAWVHVDGAFGLWVRASERFRHLLAGAEAADSWATDGHKWLNVPYDCGYAFVAPAHARAHRDSMAYQASYTLHNEQVREQKDWNPEWSRRGRGVPTYAAIRQLGRRGVAELIGRCCRCAHELAAGIAALPGAQMVWEPRINQGLVRFLDPRPGASEADHDRRTDAVVERVLATGEALFSNTTWRGRRCMRISVCNWQTDGRAVERAVAAVERALAGQPRDSTIPS